VRKILVIAKRELASYFNSPVAYIVLVTFLLVAGWMYFGTVFLAGRADLRMFFAPSPFSPSMLLVIIAPAVTMRLIAEERKSGTIELLSTMPIHKWQIVLGKFLAAWALLALAILSTVVYALTVSAIGDLDWGPVVTGYVGLLLFAGALVAIGLFCSTLTENQIVAFIIGFIVTAALYFVYWLQFFVPQGIAPAVEFLSVSFHLDALARGVLDTRNLLYYVSLMVGALFLSMRTLSKQRS
jgi:ABC-2 type transport system permease protein